MKTNIPRIALTCLLLSIIASAALADKVSTKKKAAEKNVTEKLTRTGRCLDGMDCVDQTVMEFMRKWKIPGGAVGIVKDGRLVHARGYGYSDVERKESVAPDAMFRIASISKPLTAVTILRLVEQGKLRLDDMVLKYLGDIKPLVDGEPIDKPADPRFAKITIRQCLQHTGGFDRGASFDPMFQPEPLAKMIEGPADAQTVIRFMLGRPLDFSPGEKYVYSNFGYCMLGRVIERVTGMPYEEAVRTIVLEPAGAQRARVGKTRLRDRAEGEVCYYNHGAEKPCHSLFSDVKGKVGRPYGSFYIEPMDSHGAWISSTVDLLRFTTAVDGARGTALLKPDTLKQMVEDRVTRTGKQNQFYGLGWAIIPVGDDKHNWQHSGSLPGTATTLVRAHNGLAWTALFNARPRSGQFFTDLDSMMWKAVGKVKNWPSEDLFEESKSDPKPQPK